MHVWASLIVPLLGGPFLLYLPGFLLDRATFGPGGDLHGSERHIARVVASVLLTGPLALLLATFGWFNLWLLLASVGGVCLVALRLLRRWPPATRGHATPYPPTLGLVAQPPLTRGRTAPWQDALLRFRFDWILLSFALVFGLLVARPFEVVRGGLDAGVYANTGISISRTGGIALHDPIVEEIGQRVSAGDVSAAHIASNIFGVQNKERFLSTRVRSAGFFMEEGTLATGRVVPQFFHLWPTWIAVFVALLGPTHGLMATGFAGMLGVLLLGLIGRRIAGPMVGLLSAAFLALMTPQVWFSRMPTSEALTQALLLAGIWGYTHFIDASNRRSQIWWGVLTGAAFGQIALTRVDFPLAVAPLVLLLLYVAITRRWHVGYTALALTFGVLLVHALMHMVLIARGYFVDTLIPTLQKYALTITLSWPLLSAELREYSSHRPGSHVGDWQRLGLEIAALVGLGLLMLAFWRWPTPLLRIEGWLRRGSRLLPRLMVLLLGLLAAYAYLVRPQILTLDALRQPLEPSNWLRLQGYVGAPIAVPYDQFPKKPTEAIALANMVRLGWYLSPLGVLLGVAGGLMLWSRINRRSWLLLLIATIYAAFFIGSLYGTAEQTYIYILRRYVPIVYPALALGIAYALAAICGPTRPHGHARRLRRGAFLLGTVGMVLFFVVTGRSVYAHVEYQGALAQIETLSRQIGPDDVLLVRGGGPDFVSMRDTSELVTTPLSYIYGRHALPVRGRSPAKYPTAFADQVSRWQEQGRRVFVLLGASGSDMLFPGYAYRSHGVWTLTLREFQQLREQKPKLSYTNAVPFHLYELVPAGAVTPPVYIDYDDTAAQVGGFYRSELPAPDQPRAAWTDGGGVLRLPASAQGARIDIEVSGGVRPQSVNAAHLCVDAAPEPSPYPEGDIRETAGWVEIACQELDQQVDTITIRLPEFDPAAPLLIRLRSDHWSPALAAPDPGTPASPDARRLGVRFVSARLMP